VQTIKKILSLLNSQEKKKAFLLFTLILVMSFIDMLGVASIFPFISLMSNPQLIETNDLLIYLYKKSSYLGINNAKQFLFLFSYAVFILLIFSLSLRALTIYVQVRFCLMREYSIGKLLVEKYLYQPYSWFLNKNSSDLGKNILSEVNQVIYQIIVPMMNLITQGTIIIALLLLLILIDTMLALKIALVLISAYGIIYFLMKNFLYKIGLQRLMSNKERFMITNEAFGSFKELKLGGFEENYIKRFSQPAKRYAYNQSLAEVIGLIPRYFIEALAFGGLIIIVVIFMNRGGDFVKLVPIISLYAFVGYRIIPALQQSYSALTQLKFSSSALKNLYNDLVILKSNKKKYNEKRTISLNDSIELKNVYFNYSNNKFHTLKNINLKIPAFKTVGIIGRTGSGKTTLIDILIGLLDIKRGHMLVDGCKINYANIKSWQRNIGYVPQQIYLSDDTILANIAFGIEKENIDINAVIKAAKIADLDHFISKELPDGYYTVVGERGIRLSGGQRQRIGIARALYHKPEIIVLDEATSALDIKTEKNIMSALFMIKEKMTIIIVAHRSSSIQNCDKIFVIDKGEINEQDKFKGK